MCIRDSPPVVIIYAGLVFNKKSNAFLISSSLSWQVICFSTFIPNIDTLFDIHEKLVFIVSPDNNSSPIDKIDIFKI